jgi:hypothetical protein
MIDYVNAHTPLRVAALSSLTTTTRPPAARENSRPPAARENSRPPAARENSRKTLKTTNKAVAEGEDNIVFSGECKVSSFTSENLVKMFVIHLIFISFNETTCVLCNSYKYFNYSLFSFVTDELTAAKKVVSAGGNE